MAKCVMCEKEVNGFYDYEGAKIPICFEHYEDGTFANYLAAQQNVQPTIESGRVLPAKKSNRKGSAPAKSG